MIFADLFFLYIFLPAVIIFYLLGALADRWLRSVRAKKGTAQPGKNDDPFENVVLIIFSLIFYAWGEPVYIWLMIFSVLVNYIAGLFISRGEKKSKAALTAGIIFNVAMIGVFKYSGLILETLNIAGVPETFFNPASPPVGISFYTFQSISYLADVYRGDARVQKNPFSLLLYISMFPQLIAGPIVRYSVVSEGISSRRITVSDVSEGMFRFIIGLGKKVILANQLSIISSQFLDGNLDGLSVGGAWLGIIAFTFQIYFDFSGYSDMAIGLGRCFGFRFNENFNYPYISSTITEFWRRWHISLSSFFRDYVYIPMGGNRRHQPVNILAVWLLTGLWHGASWNFVLWGLYFGIIIMLEKYTLLKFEKKIPKVILHLYSVFAIVFGWVIFYFEDFGRLGSFIKVMFGAAGNAAWDIVTQSAFTGNLYLIITALICSLPFGQLIRKEYCRSLERKGGGEAAAFAAGKLLVSVFIIGVSTLLLISGTNNPFLYFRF